MSEEKQMCVFGEEYGVCPVLPKILEMRNQSIQAMKAIYGDKSKDITDMMTTVMSTPVLNLSQYCQACPKIPRRIILPREYEWLVKDLRKIATSEISRRR